ncbi:acyl-coenzyme A thioesterase 13 [Brachypodium distachyon]|nr:acyl-coenzyme A thioesterase 13 [Brachypodium distachyon]|eukprot:XP_003564778.4 acyl-coenzyme A thioesterase 13 [Brachypodium distachyon]
MAKRLKGGSEEYNIDEATKEWHGRGAVGTRLYNAFAVAGLRVDAIDPGRARFSFTVPPRLTNGRKHMHGGAVASLVDLAGSAAFFAGGSPATGVSLDITVSFLGAARANEEIEIEAKVLGIGERTGCVTVEVRRKSTGEVLAHGRHTKYLAVSSKL